MLMGSDTVKGTKTVWIIGHRNPDLDSVVSAMAYERFKHLTGLPQARAGVAGELNRETRFVLNRLRLPEPPLVLDVRSRVKDLLDPVPPLGLSPKCTLHEVGQLMREKGYKTLPVLGQDNRLLGLVTIGDLAMAFLDRLGDQHDCRTAGQEVLELLDTPVSAVMRSDDLITLDLNDSIDEARQIMLRTRYRNYPVLDEENRYVGMISRYHLLNMNRKQVILVDHNEKSQAVDGIEEADILEIIDHHRVGDLQTVNPILFRNEPIGATSTLIGQMFQESGLTIEPELAGALLAGILSDTQIFRSPTTTERDRRTAEWLSALSGLQIETWGREIFVEAAPLDTDDPETMVAEKLKEYSHNGLKFAVAQLETADVTVLKGIEGRLREVMETLCSQRGYDLMFLMLTDIFLEGTVLLVGGPQADTGARIFGAEGERRFWLKGVMSRKKQVLPAILKALAHKDMMI